MKTKKWISFTVCAALMMSLASGCAGTSPSPQVSGETSGNTSSEAAQTKEPIIFKLASTQSPEMVAIKSLQAMADDIKEKTNGEVEVQIYPSSQLGDQRDYMEGISLGTVEMCLIATSAVESFDQNFAIFGAPGLFKNSEHVHAFYETPVCQEIFENYRKNNGVMTIGLYDEGMRNVWLSEKQVHKLEDFNGIKIRVPEVPMFVKMFGALGTNPTPMAWSECYTGLQTGVIEGVENNVEMVTSSNLTDIIKYQIKTEHEYGTLVLLLSENAFNRLSQENQKIFMECVERGNENAMIAHQAGQEAAYRAAEAAGVETIELDPAEKARIDEVLMNVTRESLKDIFPDTIYDEIEKAGN